MPKPSCGSLIASSSHTLRARGTGGDPPGNGGARYTYCRPVTTLVNLEVPVDAGTMSTDTLTRHEGLVTSLSWIPTEAIEGAQRLAFDSGITHYDVPPPTEGMDVEALRDEDRFRFANELRAFVTRGRRGPDRRLWLPRTGPYGIDAGEPTGGEASLPGRTAAGHSAASPNGATGGCASSRPAAVAPVCRRPAAYAASRSFSGRRHWCGRRCP